LRKASVHERMLFMHEYNQTIQRVNKRSVHDPIEQLKKVLLYSLGF